ncbi:MAG: HEPN domain-containing protein [Bacteroidota bacterium]
MINVAKQIEYWQGSAISNIETADILVASRKYIEGMFFCHLCIEKSLKALVVKQTGDIPIKTHDLFHLADLAKIVITEEQTGFLQILMKYQLEGRYPEYYPKAPSPGKITEYLNETKILFQCFSKML